MNKLIVKNVVYHFQDLVLQKRGKTFTNFLFEINNFLKMSDVARISYKFILGELKNIHAFLKEIQHHPNGHLLAYALKPLFGFLLDNLVVPKIVYVGDGKFRNIVRIRYSDLILLVAEERKIITQRSGCVFVIPYKGGICLQLRENVTPTQNNNWVFKFVLERMEEKCSLSMTKYGISSLHFEEWSDKQKFAFGIRLSQDYVNSDLKYLPSEIFDKEEPEVPDIPEGY